MKIIKNWKGCAQSFDYFFKILFIFFTILKGIWRRIFAKQQNFLKRESSAFHFAICE